ncbi:hypothetical protein A3E49_03260 [Candidatus Saccharibacteria bacterium RIFCSPHIGHO2_12_FULL_49_19]|nr:MAG: hypothetical protein A2708_01560 [Candidatus Saccharibacteria bacterium RIFCSPHIGHO2_01_FULL_49_21]OGL36935.1 MAG: hypothetical protein A3E49_03260 [Candidatus Saccharibacteria bacterium RIFCSPHIGHO2_12_FULL_49_19]OGL37749.1 MAG: hypothetical protein A3B63_00140 [Candidatus Saccharibacteria bacterium RIFCSPLOWO2_01_FULL_49_22]
MKNVLNKTYRGFTIIEVMIVLAIAGLIMVIVFFAIPQLQRNQRDNARQSLTTRIKSEVETYASNNQGTYPYSTAGNWNSFYTRYIFGPSLNVKDPSLGTDVIGPASGNPATFTIVACNGTCGNVTLPPTKGVFVIAAGAKCSGEDVVRSGGSGAANLDTKNYAMIIGLDKDNTRYCVDNG